METRNTTSPISIDMANQLLKEITKAYAVELVNQSKKLGSKIEGKISEVVKDIKDIDDTVEQFRDFAACQDEKDNRTITVTYNPLGDVDDLNYVKVNVSSENDELGDLDNVALLLAAAKILAKTCSGIDEDAYGGMLLEATEDWMKSVVLDALIGGLNNGHC